MESSGTDEGSEETADGVLELLPLHFDRRDDEDGVAVYRAEIDARQAPGAPVYAITVRAESPGEDPDARSDLEKCLARMRAAFLLTAPIEGEEAGEDIPRFDPKEELFIELDIVEFQPPEAHYGAVFAVGWNIADRAAGTGATDAATIEGSVTCNKPQVYAANPGRYGRRIKRHAKVIAMQGSGWAEHPRTSVWPGQPGTFQAKYIRVGTGGYLEYQLIGKFS